MVSSNSSFTAKAVSLTLVRQRRTREKGIHPRLKSWFSAFAITLLYEGSPDWIKEKYPFESLALGKSHSEPQKLTTRKETTTPIIGKTRTLLNTLGELHLGVVINLRGRSHIMNSLSREENPLIVPFAVIAENYHFSGRDAIRFIDKLVTAGITMTSSPPLKAGFPLKADDISEFNSSPD